MCVCVCEREAMCGGWGGSQHITLNKLMRQCQLASERHNNIETSAEVRPIIFIPAELWTCVRNGGLEIQLGNKL